MMVVCVEKHKVFEMCLSLLDKDKNALSSHISTSSSRWYLFGWLNPRNGATGVRRCTLILRCTRGIDCGYIFRLCHCGNRVASWRLGAILSQFLTVRLWYSQLIFICRRRFILLAKATAAAKCPETVILIRFPARHYIVNIVVTSSEKKRG